MKPLSDKIEMVTESPSGQFARRVSSMRNEGQHIVGLHVGEPDLKTAEPIIEAAKKALDDGKTKYSQVAGTLGLRTAISEKLAEFNHIHARPGEVVVGCGSKHMLYSVFQVLLNPGDEVIVPSPYWVTVPHSIRLAGGTPVLVPCAEDFSLDLQAIKSAMTAQTKAIYLNTPNNPTGVVYDKESLEALGELCCSRDLYIVSDEAYENMTYGENAHISIASLSERYFARTLSVFSFSKAFCMTGFRLGYTVGPAPIIKLMARLLSHLNGNVPEFIQEAGECSLQQAHQLLPDIRQAMEKRAYEMKRCFSDIFDVKEPQGALYYFVDVRKYLNGRFSTSEDLALYLLQKAGVAVLPGEYFGQPGYLRLSFGTSLEEIGEGARRIRKSL